MRKSSTLSFNLLSLFGAFSTTGFAEPLVTDRPDATESSSVVGANVIQLETGISFSEVNSYESSEFLGTLLRIGLNDLWELRLGWDGYIDENFSNANGLGDGEIGFKYFISPEEGSKPETAILVHTSVPIGEGDFTTDEFDPNFLLSFSHTISEVSSLGYNIGASLESGYNSLGDKSTLASIDYSIAYGVSIADPLGCYIELFGSQGLSADGNPINIDGGFTYLYDDDTQFDIFAGAGLNNDSPDWFVGVGFSKRRP